MPVDWLADVGHHSVQHGVCTMRKFSMPCPKNTSDFSTAGRSAWRIESSERISLQTFPKGGIEDALLGVSIQPKAIPQQPLEGLGQPGLRFVEAPNSAGWGSAPGWSWGWGWAV